MVDGERWKGNLEAAAGSGHVLFQSDSRKMLSMVGKPLLLLMLLLL